MPKQAHTHGGQPQHRWKRQTEYQRKIICPTRVKRKYEWRGQELKKLYSVLHKSCHGRVEPQRADSAGKSQSDVAPTHTRRPRSNELDIFFYFLELNHYSFQKKSTYLEEEEEGKVRKYFVANQNLQSWNGGVYMPGSIPFPDQDV